MYNQRISSVFKVTYYNLQPVSINSLFKSDSEEGPWEKVFEKSDLVDSRHQGDPLPLKTFYFEAKNASFLKFKVINYSGYGGGLQYFNAKFTEDTSPKPPLTGEGR